MKSLVFLGDSLTEWFDWQAEFPRSLVVNLGIAGEPVEGLLGRLGPICANIPAPDYAFVMTGINNLAMGESDILAPYRKIVGTLRNRWDRSAIVVQSILPVILDWVGPSDIDLVNSRLSSLSGECGATYLDVHRSFVDSAGRPVPSYLLDDGVHLSTEGYAV